MPRLTVVPSTTRLVVDPPGERIKLGGQDAMPKSSDIVRVVPATSTDSKRKSSNCSETVTNKRQRTATDDGSSIKHQCKSAGCGKSFEKPVDLSRHERIHLHIKPFSCTWTGCRYSAVLKGNLVQHVRMQHFKLPKLKKEQTRLAIVDNRKPEDFVQVNNLLLGRRLE